jgi:hypothetical protein
VPSRPVGLYARRAASPYCSNWCAALVDIPAALRVAAFDVTVTGVRLFFLDDFFEHLPYQS